MKTGGPDDIGIVGSSPTASAGLMVQQEDAGPANRRFGCDSRWVHFHNEFCTTRRSRDPAATTPGLHPGNDGSSPSETICRRRPGTPTAERLGLNPSVCRFDSCSGHNTDHSTRLGRQLADHPRLERRMLRVRLPPEPSRQRSRPRGAARSAHRAVNAEITGSNPVGDAIQRSTARYAIWKSGEAQTFVILRVRLPLVPLEIRVGWALACPSGCNPPALEAVQVQLLPDALFQDFRPVRLSVQDASLSRWQGGFNSRTGHF